MAVQRVSIRWCDVHLWEGEEVEGVETPMKLDLCEEHLDLSVREAMSFLDGGRSKRKTKKTAVPTEPPSSEIRAWCRANDVPVSETGKVGKESRAAYFAAHGLS